MKYAKMLGLAAVAALALMAFVGVSSAAATTVCSTSGTGTACGAGHGSAYGGAIKASTAKATLTSGFVTVECSSKMEGTVASNGSGSISSLTFESCTSSIGSCTLAKSNGTPWTANATTGTGGNGTMDVTSEVGGEFTCGGVNCKYSAANAGTKGEITITGGETATVTATKVPMSKSGGSGFCSSTSNWDGTYSVTTPDSLWIE